MEYKTEELGNIAIGDAVIVVTDAIRSAKKGTISIVLSVKGEFFSTTSTIGIDKETLGFKKIVTLPGETVKVGDKIIRIRASGYGIDEEVPVGDVSTVTGVTPGGTYATYGKQIPENNRGEYGIQFYDFLVLCQEVPAVVVKPEFDYPIYKIGKTGTVFKFTGLRTAEVIELGTRSVLKVGAIAKGMAPHTQPNWKDWVPKTIHDYSVSLKDSSYADRVRLHQVLLANGESLYDDILITGTQVVIYPHYEYYLDEWMGSRKGKNLISIKEFIEKFKKDDELRGIAMFKRSELPWTTEEQAIACRYVGDFSLIGGFAVDGKYMYNDTTTESWFRAWSHSHQERVAMSTKVAFEDLFPDFVYEQEDTDDDNPCCVANDDIPWPEVTPKEKEPEMEKKIEIGSTWSRNKTFGKDPEGQLITVHIVAQTVMFMVNGHTARRYLSPSVFLKKFTEAAAAPTKEPMVTAGEHSVMITEVSLGDATASVKVTIGDLLKEQEVADKCAAAKVAFEEKILNATEQLNKAIEDTCAAEEAVSNPTMKEETMTNPNNLNPAGTPVNVTDLRTQPKTFQEMFEELFGAKCTTDLVNKPNYVAHIFDESESLSQIIAVDSNESVIKMMQKEARKYLGFTVSVYKLYDTHALAIPVHSERSAYKKPVKKSKKAAK